jgi:hypothetical protein
MPFFTGLLGTIPPEDTSRIVHLSICSKSRIKAEYRCLDLASRPSKEQTGQYSNYNHLRHLSARTRQHRILRTPGEFARKASSSVAKGLEIPV